MDAKLSLNDVDEALAHFKSLSQAVDELAKQRAKQEPYTLPSAFTKHGPCLTAADLDVGHLGKLSGFTQGASQTPTSYKHAKAAAAEVARITSAGKRGVLRPSSRTSQPSVTTQDGATQSSQHQPKEVQGQASGLIHGKAQSLLALPGQLAYRQLLVSARRSRAPEAQAFIQELDELDDEIDLYLEADRLQRAAPAAAIMLQSAWRARGPRLMFNGYMMQRKVAALRTLSTYLGPLKQLVTALRHQRQRMLSLAFYEWRALGQLKMLLYAKMLRRLKASMIDVRDSQSPNHLWRLCTSPGQDPWKVQIGLGALCRNLIQAQAPRRKLHSYFSAWQNYVQQITDRRRQAVKVLGQLEHERSWELLHNMFRFWYRWAMVKVSERLKIQPPLFRPRLENWDTWLWEHMRSNELRVRIAQLHRGFRLRHCFNFLRGFAARNKKLRMAWMSAAIPQIEALMRYALGCLKANWQIAKAQRRMCFSAFKCWLSIARRNMLVRSIARQAEALSRTSIVKQCFRRLQEWSHLSRLLSVGATVQILQRRPLCMLPLCAWTGDHMHMWFVATWNAWRNYAVGRIRMRAFLGAHLVRVPYLDLELAFKAWRKVVHEQVSRQTLRHAQQQLKEGSEGARDATPPGGTRPTGSPSTQSAHTGAVPGRGLESVGSGKQRSPRSAGVEPGGAAATHQDGVLREAEEDEELEDGSVQVCCADFPMTTAWRPIMSNAAAMEACDEAASGANPSALLHSISQLYQLDGHFLPANCEDDDRQLVLEVSPRAPVSLGTRLILSPDNDTQFNLWLSEGSAPDPWLWQRLVGLAACSVQMHPEAPCGQLVNHDALPWTQEVGLVRLRQAAARMRIPAQLQPSRAGSAKGSGGKQQPSRRLSASKSFAHALLEEEEEEEVEEEEQGVEVQEGEQQAVEPRLPCPGSLDDNDKELMWLHRLALCEELLEGCVAGLLQIGYKQLSLMYDCIRQVMPQDRVAIMRQGDLLVELLKESVRHDTTFQAAAKLYRANRDRVITTGMSLHKHAMALARHCPEFTLTYPDYNPHSAWAEAMERVDQEDPDAPSPPRHTEQAAAAPTDQPHTDAKPGTPTGVTTIRKTPPKGSRLAAPLVQGTLSKAEIIRREMMGLQTPPTPPKMGTMSSSRSNTPPKAHVGAATTPPPDTPVALSPKKSIALPQVEETSTAASPGPTAATATQPEVTHEPVADDGSTPVTPARRPVFQMPKPMSLEEAQAKGVVLGAAAAAILAAKAAAARKAAGHKPTTAEVNQILSKPAPYKQAWKPSGYRKLANKDAKPEARPPKMRRMAPLPQLRATSPPARVEDPFASGLAVQSHANAMACEGGAAAGQAAFMAMALATSSSMHAGTGLGGEHAVTPRAVEGQHTGWAVQGQAAQQAEVKPAGPPPAPLKPYNWFGPEGRLFPTILDIPQPTETPSMQELHHRANRLMMERLDNSQYPVPTMPPIIFTDLGDPPATRAAAAAAQAAAAQAAAAQAAAAQAAAAQAAAAQTAATQTAAAQATTGSSNQGQAQAPAESDTSQSEVHESQREASSGQVQEQETQAAGGHDHAPSLSAKPSVPHFKHVNIADMMRPEEEGPESYRSGYLSDDKHHIKRVSDVGAVTNLLDEDAVAAALAEDAILKEAGFDDSSSADEWSQQRPKPAPRPRHQFTVTPEQINIYLGGHMRRRKPVEPTVEVVSTSIHAGRPRTPQTVPDGVFDTVFDPKRVVRTLSAQQRSLLTGYDLRAELREMMGAEASEAGLMGAEAVLLGTSQLTPEEQAAVQLELDRLEGELAKGVRVRRRLPGRTGGARSSFTRRPTRTSDMGLSPRSSRGSLSGAHSTLDRQGSAGQVQPVPKASSPSRFFHRAHPDNHFKSNRSPDALSLSGSPTRGMSMAGNNSSPEQSLVQPFKDVKTLRGSPDLESMPSRSPSKSQTGAPAAAERQSPGKQHDSPVAKPSAKVTRPASVSPWEGEDNQSAGGALAQQAQPTQPTHNAPTSPEPSASIPSVPPPSVPILTQDHEEPVVSTLLGLSHALPSQELIMDRLSVETDNIFPERPTSQGSAHGSIYAGSCASSFMEDAPEHRPQSQQAAFPISVYSSLVDTAVLPASSSAPAAAASDAQHSDADFIFTAGTSSIAGRRQRRKSNLRTQQAAAPGPQPGPAAGMQLPVGTSAAVLLGPVLEGVGEEAEMEQEALRIMWCSAAYTCGNDLQLPHPDSDQAAAFSDILSTAAEGDWQRYEAAAGQLVDQLTQVLNQREALQQVGPVPENSPLSNSLPAAAALGSLGSMTRHGLAGADGSQAAPRQPHQLQRALTLMEESIAAAIDPDKLTGLDLNSYPEHLSDLMTRLMVAPMATRYLFWKKVQSISQLKQRVMEDRALDDQLRQIAWNATFAPGHTVRPSGFLSPIDAANHATLAPIPATTGANPTAVRPPGWSSGALSVLTAPRIPWATPIPAASLRPEPAVIPIHQQMRLLPRVLHDKHQALEPPVASSTVPSTSQGTPWSSTLHTPASGSRPTPPTAVEHQLGDLGFEDVRDQDATKEPAVFPLQGQEALAHRLQVLLAAHQAAKRAAETQALTGGPSVPATPDTACNYLTTPNSTVGYDLDQQEAQLEAIASLTIAVHKDVLARYHQRVGHTSSTLIPGKGHLTGWAPSPVLPPGYTGRDAHQDTTDPFTYPPRPRFGAAPNPLPSITLKGAPIAVVSTTTHQAEQIARDLDGQDVQIAIETRPTPVPTPVELSSHLPAPSGQARPPRLMALPPLGPVAVPPAYAASEQQLGNLLFVTPREHAYVDYNTRVFDNTFVPGPHALGPVARGEPLTVTFK